MSQPTRAGFRWVPTLGFVFAAVFSVTDARPAAAQTPNYLYQTTFSSPTYTDGVINSTTTTLTVPGQDGWVLSSGTANLISVSNTASNGLVSLTNNGQDLQRPFDGAQIVTTGSVFFKADINVSAAQATGDYFMHFTDGTTGGFFARTYIRSATAGKFTMALGTSSGTAVTYSTTELDIGTTYTILSRYDFVAGGTTNDTGALYINPTSVDGSGDTPYITATTIGTDAGSIRAIAMRQGTTTNAPSLTLDNIDVFTVVPVPEPLTVTGLGLAFIAAGAAIRRRRAMA
jgi:trimeric autotransporter adhesin